MDAKITLSFNKEVIDKAKAYAARHNISLSRLTEYLLSRVTRQSYDQLEDFPISDWVTEVAEGQVEYKTKAKSRKALKKEYFKSRS